MSLLDKIVAAVTPPESEEDRAKAREQARQASRPGDWLDQIVQHHEQIEAAFARAEAASDSASRAEALKELGGMLTGHSSAEEAVIYPQLSDDHKVHMTMAYEEQQAAKVQLALLEALDPLSQDWVDKLGHIKGAVAHHVYEEEGDRFLDLHKELPAEVQARMTERYREEIARYQSGWQAERYGSRHPTNMPAGRGARPAALEGTSSMTSDATLAARQHDDAPVTTSKTIKPDRALLAETVTINRPAQELYAFWRSLPNLAGIMENIQSIEEIDGKRSRWTVKAPAGREVTWEALITEDIPGESISWQSTPDAEVANSGRVEFRDAGARGTVVRATIAYDPPGGGLGQLIAKLFQREPRLQTRRDLRRFKQMMETGEIATSARTQKQLAEEQA